MVEEREREQCSPGREDTTGLQAALRRSQFTEQSGGEDRAAQTERLGGLGRALLRRSAEQMKVQPCAQDRPPAWGEGTVWGRPSARTRPVLHSDWKTARFTQHWVRTQRQLTWEQGVSLGPALLRERPPHLKTALVEQAGSNQHQCL